MPGDAAPFLESARCLPALCGAIFSSTPGPKSYDRFRSLTFPVPAGIAPTAAVQQPLRGLPRRRCPRHGERSWPGHESAGGGTVRGATPRVSGARQSPAPACLPSPICPPKTWCRSRNTCAESTYETIVGPMATKEAARRITWGAPQPGDWLTYNGNDSANRYSPLKQINTSNVSSLKLKWIFPIPYFGLEVTPLAAGGVLYVTGPNQVFALDAITGNAAVAVLASAQSGHGGRCETRHQPRCRHSARQGLLCHRQRPPAGA